VLCKSEKLRRRSERIRRVKVYALKKLEDFGKRRFRLPNTRGAHVARDYFFFFFYKEEET
jgi:hypothetical protein